MRCVMEQNEKKEFPVMANIHKKVKEMVANYQSRHSKMLVVRADVRYPQNYGEVKDNKDISKTMTKFKQTLARKGLDPATIWVREQETSQHPHFHCLILADGQKTRSAGMIFDTLERHWQNTIGSDSRGLIDYCYGPADNPHENGVVVNRSEGITKPVKTQMGYICKPEGKGEPKDGMRDFGMSRIPSQHSTSKE